MIHEFESQDGSSKLSSASEDQLMEHSIISVQIEHYSFSEKENFMIAKTIEEMKVNDDNYNVIHTIRIYKENLCKKLHPDIAKLALD